MTPNENDLGAHRNRVSIRNTVTFLAFSIISATMLQTSISAHSFTGSKRIRPGSFLRDRFKTFLGMSSSVESSTVNTPRNNRREGIGKPKGYVLNSMYVLERNGAQSGLPDSLSHLMEEASAPSQTDGKTSLPPSSKPFLVLGIESSCDDTGVAIVSSNGTILSNTVYSQYKIHEKFGGVVPGLAMEAHKENIDRAIEDALREAGLTSVAEVDAISVTKGPGLEICLRVGCRKAQSLAREHRKPFVTIHHLEAHCLIARLAGLRITDNPEEEGSSVLVAKDNNHEKNNNNNDDDNSHKMTKSSVSCNSYEMDPRNILPHFQPRVRYPYLALLASGGHTSLLLCHGMGEYTMLGSTLDDALGEAFDKAARLLGLRSEGISGGAAIEVLARRGVVPEHQYKLKVPMRKNKNCDFSYSGLKTSFRLAIEKVRQENGLEGIGDKSNAPLGQMEESPEPVVVPEPFSSDLCATFQHVAFQHVEERVERALDYLEGNGTEVTSLVVVGGVAANRELRRRLLRLLSDRASGLSDCRKSKNKKNKDKEKRLSEEKLKDGEEEGPTPSKTTARGLNVPIELIFPPVSLCTDNGVMAAWAGIEKLCMGLSDPIEDQEVIPRWPIGAPIEAFST